MNDRAKAARGARSAAAVTTLLQSVCDRLPVGFALFDADLELAAWNTRFAALQGYPRKLVKAGTPLESFVRFDVERGGHRAGAIDPLTRQRLAALKRGQRTEREQALPDGRILYIASELVPGAGVLLTCEDVTENRSNEERLRESAARYELALRGISEGFYDWDIASGTIDYSQRVRNALGFSPAELKTPDDWRARIHPDDLARYDATHVAHFKGATERFECDYRYRGRDGSWRWARQHGVALRDARGRAYRMVGSTGDITELKRVEEALRASEERHALAMRAAVEGIYEWNVETDALFLSDQAKAFFAFPAEKLGPKDWNARIHPDDLESYRRATVGHFKGRTSHLELEYRIRDAAGGYRWVLDRGIAVRSAKGRVTRLIGALSDITQRKLAEIELRRARDEATAALAEQTALREVLEAISRSAFDLDAVLHTLIESATRLCRAEKGFIFRLEGGVYRLAVDFGASAEFREFIAHNPIRPGRDTLVGRTALEGSAVHIEDAAADPEYRWPESLRRGSFRTMLGVPMIREGTVVGVIAMWKERVEPFTQAQIGLATTFSNQALIAIENARLFRETKEALEHQTATAEVLRVISGSHTDLASFYRTLLSTITRLCESNIAALFLYDGEFLATAGSHGTTAEFAAHLARGPFRPSRSTTTRLAALERRTVHVADLLSDPAFSPEPRDLYEKESPRTVLSVPMLRENELVGVITTWRREVRPFTDKQIALVSTFADQAVIAIENARLFNETTEALDQLKASAEVLQVISSSVADTAPVFDKILERCERLFEGRHVGVNLVGDDGVVRLGAYKGPRRAEFEKIFPFVLREDSGTGAAILQRRVVHYPDAEGDATVPEYTRRGCRAIGVKSVIFAPMLWEGRGVGAIFVSRETIGEFSEKEIALLKTFADQAVIAIQNARLFQELEAKNRELTEALEQQTATGEILRVISSSPTDLAPVFDAVAKSAARLCDAPDVVIIRAEGDSLRFAASVGPFGHTFGPELTIPINRGSVAGRAVIERRTIQVHDLAAEPEDEYPVGRGLQRRYGHRTMVAAPLLLGDTALGAIAMLRTEVRPFSDKQLALLQTFGDQAVIAIENVRLFTETKEALEQQRASAEVLSVISNSMADARPVFEKIVESCERLFASSRVGLNLIGPDGLVHAGAYGNFPGAEKLRKENFPHPVAGSATGTAIIAGRVVHYPDVFGDPDIPPYARRGAETVGFRSFIMAPLLSEGRGLGAIFVGRGTVGAFSEKEMALLETFSDQAVIAIQNARLFNETKEALERQAATAEILKVISRSTFDLQTVLDTLVEAAARLCDADHAWLFRREGEMYRWAASYGHSREQHERIREYMQTQRVSPGRGTLIGRTALERRAVHIPDALADPEYEWTEAQKLGQYRTTFGVPLLRESVPIGVLALSRSTVRPLTDKQIELATTFADQAVIAIENVRLFNETKEALDQQKALAEVLQVISSSVADTRPVFEKILESCERLFEGRNVGITLVDDDGAVRLGPYRGPHRRDLESIYPLPLSGESGSGSAILERRVMHYPDVEGGTHVPEPVRRGCKIIGLKSIVFAPMLWEGRSIGTIFVGRATVGEFSDKEIALLKTFADQAVIAIQNARLFREIQEKSRQLEIADQHKSAFLANMSHELRTPLNAVIGFSEMLSARYFGELTEKQAEYVNDIHGSGKHLLSLINDILDLSKIEAGRMELELAEFDLRGALDNALTLVRERAQRGGVALQLDTDPRLRSFRGDKRKLKQVVLNLLSNAVKFTPRGGSVSVVAKQVDGSTEIAVSDTGVGIAPADQEAIFEAFRQVGTDATRKREGTGLGLALARRFVELHGGTIRVESTPGKGSTFTVRLPIRHGE